VEVFSSEAQLFEKLVDAGAFFVVVPRDRHRVILRRFRPGGACLQPLGRDKVDDRPRVGGLLRRVV
jgi:hypothetical protein